LVVPCALVQVVPQAPQLVTVEFRFVSQPLAALPSQLPKPELHVGTQLPAVHVVEPFAFVQAVPQAPQFAVEVFRFASQPVEARPSQLPKPVLQVTEHDPSAHDAVPLVPLQAVPQAPQFAVDVSVLVSQPFELFESQLP
jgi:hypothetical protein